MMSRFACVVAALLRSLRRSGNEFVGMRSGAVAVIFALAAIPIFLMLGVAVDYGRATLAKSHLQGAVDSAAIQVGAQALAQPNLTQAQLQQLAANMVAVNLGASAASLNLSVT